MHLDIFGPIYLGVPVCGIRSRKIKIKIVRNDTIDADTQYSAVTVNPSNIMDWVKSRVERKQKRKTKRKDMEGYTKLYILVTEDDCTRFGTFDAIPDKSGETVTNKSIDVFDEYGYPLFTITDNGKEFRSAVFQDTLQSQCVIALFTIVKRPQTNGKVERLIKTLREFLADKVFNTIEELQEELRRFQQQYNYERPNQAIGNLPPATFLSLVNVGMDSSMLKSGGTCISSQFGSDHIQIVSHCFTKS